MPSMVLKTRELFVRQRSQTANAMRAHMAELGIIAATGMTSIAKLIAVLRDDRDERLPNSARTALLEMAEQIEKLTARVEAFDTKIVAAVKADEAARRLTTIPGVGPIIAGNRPCGCPRSCSLSNQAGLGGMDRHHTKGEFQRRKGAARQDIKAG